MRFRRAAQVIITPAHLGLDFAPGHCFEEPGDDARADTVDDAASRSPGPTPAPINLREATREQERALIHQALARTQGNWAAAARLIGTSRSNLHHLAQRLGLK